MEAQETQEKTGWFFPNFTDKPVEIKYIEVFDVGHDCMTGSIINNELYDKYPVSLGDIYPSETDALWSREKMIKAEIKMWVDKVTQGNRRLNNLYDLLKEAEKKKPNYKQKSFMLATISRLRFRNKKKLESK